MTEETNNLPITEMLKKELRVAKRNNSPIIYILSRIVAEVGPLEELKRKEDYQRGYSDCQEEMFESQEGYVPTRKKRIK